MVFIEPGLAQQIGTGGLDQLVAGINHVINPDYGFQQAMKQQLALNPKLAQSLADLEVQAPGTLKKLGFGPLANVLQAVPESAQGQVAREAKPNIVATEKAKIGAEGAQATFEGSKFAGMLNAIEGDTPDAVALRHELINRSLTGTISPQDELAQTRAQTREQTARANVLEAQAPGDIAEAKAKADLQARIAEHPELQTYDPVRIVRDLSAGRTVPNLDLYLARPGAPQALSAARIIFEAQENRDNRLLLRAQFDHQMDLEKRQLIQQAGAAWKATKTGTIKAWETVIQSPDIVEQIKANGPKNQEEQDILHASEAQDQVVAQQNQKQIFADIGQFRTNVNAASIDAKRAGSEAGIELAIAPLNKYLATTAPQYQAKYGPPPDVGETGKGKRFGGLMDRSASVYFVGPDGRRVEDSAISNFIANPNASTPSTPKTENTAKPTSVKPTKLSGDASRALMVIKSKSGADRQASIDWIQKNKPEIYNQIQSQIAP